MDKKPAFPLKKTPTTDWFTRFNTPYFYYLLLLLAYYFFRHPVYSSDTDLWYHLTGGRYFFQNGVIPNKSFFSFIVPEKAWLDYYWLFQVIAYKIYDISGYYGLIVLRGCLYVGTLIFIFLFLKRNQHAVFLPIFFCVFSMVLFYRGLNIRPHLFTYLYMAIFLYILEYRTDRVFLLPIIGILWSNQHGIEYPVMVLITGSYLADTLIRLKTRQLKPSRETTFYLVMLIFTVGTVFITPYGVSLIKVPFIPTEFASDYIEELVKLDFESILAFKLPGQSGVSLLPFNIFMIFAIPIIMINITRWDIRPAHLILVVGGIILLLKGVRFVSEFAILALPTLKTGKLRLESPMQSFPLAFGVIFSCFLILFPAWHFHKIFQGRPAYPFSHKNLPHGVCLFLNKIDKKGEVFNLPNSGGYLQWMLYPEYKIYIDMKVPHLFTDEEYFISTKAFQNRSSLKCIIDAYHPGFISAPVIFKNFPAMMKTFPEYSPVFFDDAEILYANKLKYPGVVSQYELTYLDDYLFHPFLVNQLPPERIEKIKTELSAIIDTYPNCAKANQILSIIHLGENAYPTANENAERIIAAYPEWPEGYVIKGDIFFKEKQYDKALTYYTMAQKRTDQKGKEHILKQVWQCYNQLGMYEKAYKALKNSGNIFTSDFPYTDLYHLAFLAYQIGKHKESLTLLQFAKDLVPEEDVIWSNMIDKQLAMFGREKAPVSRE